jgi:nucleoid DNA-binding protein
MNVRALTEAVADEIGIPKTTARHAIDRLVAEIGDR